MVRLVVGIASKTARLYVVVVFLVTRAVVIALLVTRTVVAAFLVTDAGVNVTAVAVPLTALTGSLGSIEGDSITVLEQLVVSRG